MKNLTSFIQEKLQINKDNKVKKSNLNKDNVDDISDVLFNCGEHIGFRKSCNVYEIKTDDLEDRIKEYYHSDADGIPEDFYDIIRENASENILTIFGVGYDRTWAIVIFFSTNPYTFIVSKNGYNKSKVYKIKDQKEVIDEIVDFCQ